MNHAINTMLNRYDCHTEFDYINALKEIFQEIALLALWRSKFFEHAAFYGGTALRILYGLDRFSEDLDFSLLLPNQHFKLDTYNQAIGNELSAFGFDVSVTTKRKSVDTAIESAFIKANTIQQFLAIDVPSSITHNIHAMNTIKIKMEIDTDPPNGFTTEAKPLLLPIPFSVLTYSQHDLFAGKIHALLCRQWETRVKGRDWYDYVWYISRNSSVHLSHLQSRLIQSSHWDAAQTLSKETLISMLIDKIHTVDFDLAKKDVMHFVKDKASLSMWSKHFFVTITQQLQVC